MHKCPLSAKSNSFRSCFSPSFQMSTEAQFYHLVWPHKFHSFSTSQLKGLLENIGYFGCSDGPPNRHRMLTVLDALLPVSEQLAREYEGLTDYRATPKGNNLTCIESKSYLVPEQFHLDQTSSKLGTSLNQLHSSSREELISISEATILIGNAANNEETDRLEELISNLSSRVNSFESNIQDSSERVYANSYQLATTPQYTMNHLVRFIKRFEGDTLELLSLINERSAGINYAERGFSELTNCIGVALQSILVDSDDDSSIPEPPNSLENNLRDIEFNTGSIHYRLRRIQRSLLHFDSTYTSVQKMIKEISTIRDSINTVRRLNIQTDFAHFAHTHRREMEKISGSLESMRMDISELKEKEDEIDQAANVISCAFTN